MSIARVGLIVVALVLGAQHAAAASEHYGQVTLAGLPVPGVSVTASRGEQQVVTSTNQQGVYRFADLADGPWTIRVEMVGFAPLTREVDVVPGAMPQAWALTHLPLDQISQVRLKPDPTVGGEGSGVTPVVVSPVVGSGVTPTVVGSGFSRTAPTNVQSAPNPANVPNVPNDPNGSSVPNDPFGTADGLLINGSVNNGAASPFAQLAAFGNNRRGGRSLYNGGIGVLAGSSAWDSRPFSFTAQRAPKPNYNDVQMIGTFGGPFRIPGLTNRANLFVGYQRTADTNASMQSALMPSALERGGNFSQTLDPFGRLVRIIDPLTGQPFPGNTIPRERISPQAAALLGLYPQPNLDADGRYNFQRPVVTATRQDSVQSRVTQVLTPRSQLFGTFAYQRNGTDATSVFGFEDESQVSGVDTGATWSYRFSQFLSLRLRYQLTRLANRTTPYFSNRTNVSGDAGITGNNQDPLNWGPPSLSFLSGIAGLTDAQYAFTRNTTHAVGVEDFLSRGRHNWTFGGGGVRRHHIDVLSQQDPRGTFAFTGAATGSDFADFLLGIPSTSSIAFGNADKLFRASSYDAFVTDDWRLSPGLTLNVGMRWEYESPITERFGRLVNLDVAPGFTAIAPVLSSETVGELTGRRYPDSLLHPDRKGFQPRLGAAWRPIPGSSLVIRAGYGIYRNTAVYQSIATLLAQQPPLSRTFSVANSAATPLTLANGFIVSPGMTANTFAVDPDFRVGYAHNWQASVQRDLPASLTVMGSYLGARGSQLMQQFLPNTYPAGTVNPCPSCPSGFIYLTSNGSSSRHAGQIQVRRRLRDGFTATVQYTLAKAMDNAAAFGGANLSAAAIAQDWLDLDAEHARSNFDQRHLFTAQFQYTTGVGLRGGALLDGLKGALFKGWTMTSQLTAGSGLPLTPIYLALVPGTGITGTIRADVTDAATGVPEGYYLNPAAYVPPIGHWGTAGRNSVTGPSQFSLNMGVARTFPWGDRLNLDWRIDATNILNRVTYASVNTIVGSPQFGLPNRANPMRKIQTTFRLRF